MTSKKVDSILLLLGAVLILISSYQLFLVRLGGENSGLSLGTLIQTESVVKMKNSRALDWRDAFSGAALSESQLIYTDDNSSAEVRFLQGHQVLINENSLVRLASLGEGLNVKRGLIRAKLAGNEPLVIEVNGSPLTLKGKDADVQINLQNGNGEIGVLSGEVAVEKNGQVEQLDQKSALTVSGEELKKHTIAYKLVAPREGQTIGTLSPVELVNFKWEPASSGKLTLSQNSTFTSPIYLEGEGTAAAELIPGTYFWKVEDASGASLVGSFSVIKETAPTILRPLNGEELRLLKPEVFLQWKGKNRETFEVEWNNPDLNSKIVEAPGLMISLTNSGTFSWRVRRLDKERPLAPWSEWQELNVALIEPPKVPTDLLPQELELQSYAKENHEVELSWKAASAVEIELSADGKNSYLRPQGSSHVLNVSKPGEYRWRLRGIDEFARTSEWSEWRSFTLEDLSHEVSSEGFQRIQLKKPDQAVTFNWQAQPDTQTVFELSEEKDFSQVIIKKDVAADQVQITVPKTGNYYWRSRQFKPDGSFEVSEPRKVIIEPAPAPLKPQKLPDMEVPLEILETQHKSSWLDWFIAPVYADDELKAVARIKLPDNEDAKKYVLRIYRDAEATQLVLEQIVEGSIFEWHDPTAGHYYWQYALIDYWDRQSPFSDLSSLVVKGWLPQLPEKVRLQSPIRAVEVEASSIHFNWSDSGRNKSYRLEISREDDFEKILFSTITKESQASVSDQKFAPGLHYWRIFATNETKREVVSNTGRFTVKPPLEKIIIADQKPVWKKLFGTRLSLSWAPSMDTYDFKGDDKGSIDGTVLNGLELRGQMLTDKLMLAGEILRQSGEVFEGESYLFQRLLLAASWKQTFGQHLWGPGLTMASVSGYSYEVEVDEVTSSSVSGLAYGPHVEGWFTLSPRWELQVKAAYLLGAIPHLDLRLDGLQFFEKFCIIYGVGYSGRSYANEGSQTAISLRLGLGKEF